MPIYISYYTLALITYILLSGNRKIYSKINIDEESNEKQNYYIFILICLLITLYSGFRHIRSAAIDEYAYRNRWHYFQTLSFKDILTVYSEYLFQVVFWISTKIFNTDQGGIFLTSIITIPLTLYSLKRDCWDFQYGVLLFFVSGWFWTSFNGVQQICSTSFYFMFYLFAVKRQLIYYGILLFVCMLIHQSTICILPFYFFGNIKGNGLKQIYILLTVTVGLIFLYRFIGHYANLISMFERFADINEKERHGVKLLTIFISCIPSIIYIYLCSKKINLDQITQFAGNISTIHAGIMIASLIDTYIARFGLTTSIFTILFLARIGKYINNSTMYKQIKWVSIFLYAFVNIIRMKNSYYYFNFKLW